MTPKCAFCNSDKLVTVDSPAVPWTFRKCPECGGMNKFRPIDQWEGDLKTTTIVSEMLPSGSTAGSADPPWYSFPTGSRASDAELGRAITNIINRSKK